MGRSGIEAQQDPGARTGRGRAPGNATDTGPPRGSVFERVAALSARHRWWALLLWVVLLAGTHVLASGAGDAYRNDFSLPGTDSQRALDVMREHGSVQAGDSVQIVLHDEGEGGVRATAVRKRVEPMLEEVGGLPGVAQVRSPYKDGSAVSRDGTTAYAAVTLDGRAEQVPPERAERVLTTARGIQGDGLRVELGGEAARAAEESGGGGAEGAGILGALVVLVFLFGSLIAAGVPVVTAVFAVGTALGLIVLASHVFTVADFTPYVMMLVGLGVGIDYALLIFTRYRGELLQGQDRESAARRAMDAAGRTVFFAGCTVIIALLGLVVLGLGSLQGVALAVALTVLVTMLASLTLLPALLAVAGGRIERNVARRAAKRRDGGQGGAGSDGGPGGSRPEGAGWRRWGAAVQRRPWAALLVSVIALGALAAPAAGLRLGFADAGNDPRTKSSRAAYDLLADGFGPGFNGPLIVVAESRGGESVAEAAGELRRELSGVPGIAGTSPPVPTSDPSAATVFAHPGSAPQDEATSRLVAKLRADVLPPLEQRTGARFLVGGATAASEDFAATVADRMPLFVGVVVGLSALLLTVVFRSVLIPLKAALLNLLSIGASLGVVTLVFQHGWFGVQPGPVEAFIPVMIFAIVFGLSMDYEVFLLSRIHEEWERTRDPSLAVREGLAHTGKVITAAGAIMIVVFAAFMLSPDRMLQQFGLGLAVAIMLDAVVIRCLVVPAVMRLLGRAAWWLPGWLRKALPRVRIEHG
ncbi:putative drug exporter of the RND superfamily [Streptomyces sp. WMMB 714]|uniref:MMPL family transporter n=1 Tax=Streptomyces sp. WMMB 714 TaxID=1286822 RepID=UPI0006983B20|nr:MMPL family transporter [Streptomyces sp. WMMB 714]SCK50430.1 putative drug exporter of the RND superfamily [Streptomyces sp. WMMB 714]